MTSFNGAFFTLIVDDEIADEGKRMREGEENFCLQVDDSSTMWLCFNASISSSSSSSLSVSHRLLSSSLNNG